MFGVSLGEGKNRFAYKILHARKYFEKKIINKKK